MKIALAMAAAVLMTATLAPVPAAACHHTCSSSSTGGTQVPAPGVAALFAIGVAGLVARRRRARG